MMNKEFLTNQEILNNIDDNLKIEEQFFGGMSNYTYLIKNINTNKFLTLRIPLKEGKHFVNFETELETLNKIKDLDINSELIYFNQESGIKISNYINGKNIDNNIDLDLVTDVLKKLHNSNLVFSNYNHLARLEKYESLLTSNEVNESYLSLKQQWLYIYNDVLKHHLNYPTHGDAQPNNFIISNDAKLYLLDWEFSGQNDFIYDIATFGNIDFNMSLDLLANYLPKYGVNELKRLYGWKIYQCLQWYLVACYKAKHFDTSSTNLDFNQISTKYINNAKLYLEEYKNL